MFLEKPMNNLPPFVWVEIGRRPGKYALNAISINKELFPDQERFLIVSKQYQNKLPKELCTMIFEEELKKCSNYADFNALEKQWSYSHNSYWQNTTKRFFVIENFMFKFGYEKIIHLESDCLLLTMDYLRELFSEDGWGIKYTKQANGTGCASILVVNKAQAIQEFNSYVLKNWQQQDIVDMTLLGNYALDKKDANYLPSGDKVHSKIVFDAGTIGRYFLGGEARNNRIPVSSRGRITSEKGAFCPSKFKVGKIKDGLFLIDIKDENNNLQLGCIHVHSKRIPKRNQKLINRLIRESNSNRGWFWRLGRLDFTVVCERILSKLSKVIPWMSDSDFRLR
jgi:hypothetical protein